MAKGALNQVGGEFAGWAIHTISHQNEGNPIDEKIQEGFNDLSNRLKNLQATVIKLRTDIEQINKNILAVMEEVKRSRYDTLFNSIWEKTEYLKSLHNELYELSIRSDLGSPEAMRRADQIKDELDSLKIREALSILRDPLTKKNGIFGDLDNLIDLYGNSFPCDYDQFEKMLAYFFHYQIMALNLLMEKAHVEGDNIHAQQHLDYFTGKAEDTDTGMDIQMAAYRSWVEKMMLCSTYNNEWIQPGGIEPSRTVLRMQKVRSELLGNSGLEFEVWVRMRGLNWTPGGTIILQGAEPGNSYDDTGKCWGVGTGICSQQKSLGLLPEKSASSESADNVGNIGCTLLKDHAAIYHNIYPNIEPGSYKIFNQYDYYNEEGDEPSMIGECYYGKTTYQYNHFSERFMNHTITIPEGDYISNLMIYLYEDLYRIVENY